MLFIISLLLYCALVVTSWSDGRGGGGAVGVHLDMVFGRERMETHFPSRNGLEEALTRAHEVQHDLLSVVGDEGKVFGANYEVEEGSRALAGSEEVNKRMVLPQIACVLYDTGRETKEVLMSIFGDGNVDTVFVSQRDNRMCFLVASTLQQLQSLVRQEESLDEDIGFDWSSIMRTLGALDFV